MPKNLESENIAQLLAEAEELIQQIESDASKDIKEEHRLQVEKHAQNLKKIKSEVQAEAQEKGTSEIGSSAEGMHRSDPRYCKGHTGLEKQDFLIVIKSL